MINTKAFHAALDAVARSGKKSFKITYQIWLSVPCEWQHCEFYLFATDKAEAKKLAVKYCRDNNGQPIDYYNLEVEMV